MIFGIMLDADELEEQKVRHYLSELTAYYTDKKLEIRIFHKSESFEKQLEEMNLLDMAVIDVTIPGALQEARLLRQQFAKAEILLIADLSVSPMKYMNPSIRASALLLRPMTQTWKDAIRDFFVQLAAVDEQNTDRMDVLWIKNRDGSFRIPYNQIYYLEAREKKVFVRTRTEEYGVTGTIEKLLETLPEKFKRCHRSFVVNKEHITRIRLSENLLYLDGELMVPLSRSYKGEFKRHSNEEIDL